MPKPLSPTALYSAKTLSVAPMLDLTDRHYRFMARLLSRHAVLYSEMIHADAINRGDTRRFLEFSEIENPLVLQLGGSNPASLAQAASAGESYGYSAVNLNCGCPSPKVQKGAFGACLMNTPGLVADCLNAMQDAVSIPVTVKHRIGTDRQTDYAVVAEFVSTLLDKTACRTFIVHARNAWLDGLSPKDNREVPPLRYDYVYRLKKDFPDAEIIINGGIDNNDAAETHLQHTDGVMIGREAYYRPIIMAEWDTRFYSESNPPCDGMESVVRALYTYAVQSVAAGNGTTLRHMFRHYLGLMHGRPGARQWRRMLSDPALLGKGDPALILSAWEMVCLAAEDKEHFHETRCHSNG